MWGSVKVALVVEEMCETSELIVSAEWQWWSEAVVDDGAAAESEWFSRQLVLFGVDSHIISYTMMKMNVNSERR